MNRATPDVMLQGDSFATMERIGARAPTRFCHFVPAW
jgi:hypothetical protein